MRREGRLCLAAFYRPPKLCYCTHTHIKRRTRLSQPSHSMRSNLSHIKKAGAEEKQDSSKLATLSRVTQKKSWKEIRRNKNVDVLFSDDRVFWCANPKRSEGEEEQRGWCLSQRWALTEILYTCDLTCSPLSLFPLFQHLSESVFGSS